MVAINLYLIFSALSFLTWAAPTTPADAHHVLQRRANCLDSWEPQYFGLTSDAVICINQLAAKGNTPCKAGYGTTFCRQGYTEVIGYSGLTPAEGIITQSPCQDVARGAARILDQCSRGDGKVKGYNFAWGNGNLQVTIRRACHNEPGGACPP